MDQKVQMFKWLQAFQMVSNVAKRSNQGTFTIRNGYLSSLIHALHFYKDSDRPDRLLDESEGASAFVDGRGHHAAARLLLQAGLLLRPQHPHRAGPGHQGTFVVCFLF